MILHNICGGTSDMTGVRISYYAYYGPIKWTINAGMTVSDLPVRAHTLRGGGCALEVCTEVVRSCTYILARA